MIAVKPVYGTSVQDLADFGRSWYCFWVLGGFCCPQRVSENSTWEISKLGAGSSQSQGSWNMWNLVIVSSQNWIVTTQSPGWGQVADGMLEEVIIHRPGARKVFTNSHCLSDGFYVFFSNVEFRMEQLSDCIIKTLSIMDTGTCTQKEQAFHPLGWSLQYKHSGFI